VRRVLVVGITGAGKTTAARRLARALDVPFHEMDELAIESGWRTPASFVADVEAILRTDAWVIDSYGYDAVRSAMWDAADTVVWLDYSARVMAPRVVRRSLARSLRRTPVFGGNIETWRGWLSPDHPVWSSLRRLRARRRVIGQLAYANRREPLQVLRFRDPAELDRWWHEL
jgi:adenylate kinase family enzyme